MPRLSLIAAAKFLCLLPTAAAAGAPVVGDAPNQDALVVPGRVTIVIHGVGDDGAGLSHCFKEAVDEQPTAGPRPEIYLFRWTQPDGDKPAVGHARNSLKGIEERYHDGAENKAAYQVAVAERLRNFLVGARRLYREYGVNGRIDVVAHSQGTLITLEALDQGGEADNLVFLGSPLQYAGERQDDVIGALPHVRGVLYNYYTPSDGPIECEGGFTGVWFVEPRGWPEKDLPKDKVVQVKLNVNGHSGYCTEEAIRANYLDKLAMPGDASCRLPADKAREFQEKWRRLTADAGLIDPE